jgi:hypothetical protein
MEKDVLVHDYLEPPRTHDNCRVVWLTQLYLHQQEAFQ